MYRYDTYSEKIQHTESDPPMLFVFPSKYIQIEEVILGPKFENVSSTIPYLWEQLEKMAGKIHYDIPKISISNIDYR